MTERFSNESRERKRIVLLHGTGAFALIGWVVLAWLSRRSAGLSLAALFAIVCCAWVSLAVAWAAAKAAPRRHVLRAIWIWGLLFRVCGFFGSPVLEDDWARYLWDGRQFAVTGNPYASTPATHFHDRSLPEPFPQLLDEINHPDLPTVYGPVCQFAFLVSYYVAPGRLWPLKLILLAADLVTLALLLRLTTAGNALLYAWCPLLIQESAFTAHPELLWIAPMVVALHGISRRTWIQVGIGCGLAIGAKLFALIIVPFLLRRGGPRTWLVCLATAMAGYAWFWFQGSFADLASVRTMADAWEFNSMLVALLHQGFGWSSARLISGLLFAIAWAAFFFWDLRRDRREIPRGDLIYGSFFLCSPIVNPWYLLALLPFVSLRPTAWGFAALGAVTLSYVHGLNLAGMLLAPYEVPWPVRICELFAVLLAIVGGRWWQRRRLTSAKGDGD